MVNIKKWWELNMRDDILSFFVKKNNDIQERDIVKSLGMLTISDGVFSVYLYNQGKSQSEIDELMKLDLMKRDEIMK